ncbi:MAG: QcrA and Rieske domain-containing protein [Thermogutta sp.]
MARDLELKRLENELNQHADPSQVEAIRRRSFLGRGFRQLLGKLAVSRYLAKAVFPALVTISGLVVGTWIRFLWPNRKLTVGRWQRLSHINDLSPDAVNGQWVISHGVWIVRRTDQGRDRLFVLRAACTHLGCTTQWDPALRQFVCPCHGSAFSLDGSRLRGPATRALDRCAIRISSEGFVEIDPSRTLRDKQGEIDHL